MNLSKLQKKVEDREAWCDRIYEVSESDMTPLMTEQQQQSDIKLIGEMIISDIIYLSFIYSILSSLNLCFPLNPWDFSQHLQ